MDIRTKISAAVTWLCTSLLALLGYSCSSEEELLCMYGTPTRTFEVKGVVTNEKGQPVEDAEIRVTLTYAPSGLSTLAKTTTDRDGAYHIDDTDGFCDSLKIVCIPPGDLYQPDSVNVRLIYQYDDEHPKDSWYWGHAIVTANLWLKYNTEE